MGTKVFATVTQRSATASQAHVRQHALWVDRPESKGGTDRGPMGGELMLAGIGGCFMSNLLAAAHARNLPVADLSVSVTAVLEDAPPRFTELVLVVSGLGVDTDAIRALIASAEQTCIAANTIKPAVRFSVELA